MTTPIMSENDLQLLARMIIHDLDAPVAVIERVLTRMLSGNFNPQNPAHARLIRTSLMSLGRTQRMMCDLQEVISTRELAVRLQPIGLEGLVEDIARQFSPMADADASHFEWRCTADAEIVTDPDLLFRIADNLLLNALYHTDSGNPIFLEASAIKGGGYQISVTNYGSTIPEEHLEAIFQPGIQLEMTLKRRWKGHGLGLAFCRLAAEALGGRISAANLPAGDGVVFEVKIGGMPAGSA